jgi:CBS domain-containing protein
MPDLAGFRPRKSAKFAAARHAIRLASPKARAQHCRNDRDIPAGFAFRPQIRLRTKCRKTRSIVMQVRHILQGKGRDVVTIASNATVCDAAKLLTAKKIGALLVKDKSGKLSGIISERDLVRAMAQGGADSFTDPVSAHMTPAPQTCVESDTVESVMETMTRGRFRHVPVLDSTANLCGMISIGDVVKTRIAETVNEAAALRDYISAAV